MDVDLDPSWVMYNVVVLGVVCVLTELIANSEVVKSVPTS